MADLVLMLDVTSWEHIIICIYMKHIAQRCTAFIVWLKMDTGRNAIELLLYCIGCRNSFILYFKRFYRCSASHSWEFAIITHSLDHWSTTCGSQAVRACGKLSFFFRCKATGWGSMVESNLLWVKQPEIQNDFIHFLYSDTLQQNIRTGESDLCCWWIYLADNYIVLLEFHRFVRLDRPPMF